MIYKTNCNFPLNGEEIIIFLATKSELIKIVGEIFRIKRFHEEAVTFLGFTPEFIYENFTYDEWLSDCLTRAKMIKNHE